MTSSRLSLTIIGAVLVSIVGCQSRSAVDTIQLQPEDDVFLAQSPYGLDSSVVVLAKVPPARYQNGCITLTGGRELVIVQPNAWRGYTGQALTTEESQQRINRAEETGAASKRLRSALEDLNRELVSFKATVQDGYHAKPTPDDKRPAEVWRDQHGDATPAAGTPGGAPAPTTAPTGGTPTVPQAPSTPSPAPAEAPAVPQAAPSVAAPPAGK